MGLCRHQGPVHVGRPHVNLFLIIVIAQVAAVPAVHHRLFHQQVAVVTGATVDPALIYSGERRILLESLTFNLGCGAGAKSLFGQVGAGARPTAPAPVPASAPTYNDAYEKPFNWTILITEQNV